MRARATPIVAKGVGVQVEYRPALLVRHPPHRPRAIVHRVLPQAAHLPAQPGRIVAAQKIASERIHVAVGATGVGRAGHPAYWTRPIPTKTHTCVPELPLWGLRT